MTASLSPTMVFSAMREPERPRLGTPTMRIVTWNVNGIRAAIRKGIDRFFESVDADVWLLQEIRCLPEQLPKDWQVPEGYEMIWHPAEKKGYSGVATLSEFISGLGVSGISISGGSGSCSCSGRFGFFLAV